MTAYEPTVPDAEDITSIPIHSDGTDILVWYPFTGEYWVRSIDEPTVDVTQLIESSDFTEIGWPDYSEAVPLAPPE